MPREPESICLTARSGLPIPGLELPPRDRKRGHDALHAFDSDRKGVQNYRITLPVHPEGKGVNSQANLLNGSWCEVGSRKVEEETLGSARRATRDLLACPDAQVVGRAVREASGNR